MRKFLFVSLFFVHLYLVNKTIKNKKKNKL